MSKITILQTELESSEYTVLVSNQDYPAIANLLNNKPLIDNPEPQADVPTQLSLLALFEAITPLEGAEFFKNYNGSFINRIEQAVNANDRQNIEALFGIVKTFISQESQNNVTALLDLTEPDPNWQPQVLGQSRAEELDIYPVSAQEVQEALN
jgi:hypothetical protein